MFGHVLKTIKGMFSRREQAKDTKKKLAQYAPKKVNTNPDRPLLSFKFRPFKIRHGRREAGCRWWPEAGTGYIIKIIRTKNRDFLYRVAFPFLGAHRADDGFKKKWVGLRGGCLLLPASELS